MPACSTLQFTLFSLMIISSSRHFFRWAIRYCMSNLTLHPNAMYRLSHQARGRVLRTASNPSDLNALQPCRSLMLSLWRWPWNLHSAH